MEDFRPKILDFVRRSGPVLPVKISKEIGRNILLSGAIMSELVHNKKLMISHAKIGGSPVYFLPGQEYRLSVLYPHLREKERKVYDILREKKILRDPELEPWQRVALRDLKDFAVMLKVNNNGVEEVFWKWYLLDDKNAESLVREKIGKKLEVEEKREEIVKEKITKKRTKVERSKLNILDYFKNRNITVLEENIVRKNKEIDYIVNVNSELGRIKFFVKVRDKAKVNDRDLMLAQSQAQRNNLPLLFLSNGELTKRGKEYLEKNHLLFERI